MIKISNIKVPVDSGENELRAAAAKAVGLHESQLSDFAILKKSVDARHKTGVHAVCSVAFSAENEERIISRANDRNVISYSPKTYEFPETRRKSPIRPVVVGMGPAGLFAALELAEAGLAPIVLERGKNVDERTADVQKFWQTGVLDEMSNVQFGEGGAGTFSDGKLATGISDRRVSHVFETFVKHGAPVDIMYSSKPHIGTDVLQEVVRSMRAQLIELGADVRFQNTLTGIKTHNGAVSALNVSSPEGEYELACDALILAPGHSARDCFDMLNALNVPMERKAFAIGVRIEHDQKKISESQFGQAAEKLPPADYKLSCHLKNGRSAYSFCVCPGGQVIAAASEQGRLVTNGMSLRARDGKNINGGFLVGVSPEDFDGSDPLAGVRFQRMWEQRAFEIGGKSFAAPVQTVGDFLARRPSKKLGSIEPTYLPGVVPTDISRCLPKYVSETLRGALPVFDRTLHGFADPQAVLTGIETRSSSPVRILRGEDYQSPVRGIYPCGEGAGYAGGITSAAVDGIKVAEAVASKE